MKEQEKKIQEMQILEQNLQNMMLQKQTFQMELSETTSAIEEIKNSGDEVFKIIGQLMIKADKKKTLDELSNKEKILSIRLKSIEKQENLMIERLESMKQEFMESTKE
jgi:prefoldin beta subunit